LFSFGGNSIVIDRHLLAFALRAAFVGINGHLLALIGIDWHWLGLGFG